MRSWMPGETGWTEHGPRKTNSADEDWAKDLDPEVRQAMREHSFDRTEYGHHAERDPAVDPALRQVTTTTTPKSVHRRADDDV